jgi:Tissue inhibitor of metalloproteinase
LHFDPVRVLDTKQIVSSTPHTTMKSLALLSLFLFFPTLTFACSCLAPITLAKSLKSADSVFRGTVIRKLKDAVVDDQGEKSFYEVRVIRLFKGCNFIQSNHIIVTTGSNSAACGVELEVDKSYALFGANVALPSAAKKQLGTNPKKIAKAVAIGLCGYNAKWSDLSTQDLKTLRRYDNSKCKPKCVSGKDCPNNNYCDAGKCVAFDAKCPTPLVNCFASPCSVSTCTSPSTCYDNYCGGCNAIFVDDTGTRVC